MVCRDACRACGPGQRSSGPPHGPLHLSADRLAVLAHACHEHEQLFQPGQADGNHPIEARLDRENNMRRSNLLPREKRRYDHGESRENLLHNTKQATLDPGQLRAISGTAEIIKRKQKQRSLFSMYLLFQKKQIGNSFLQMWKEAWRIHSRIEENAQVTIEESCQIIQSLEQLRISEQVAHQDLIHWAAMGDNFRRCLKKRSRRPKHQTKEPFPRLC